MPGFEWIDKAEQQEVNQVMSEGFSFRYNFDAIRNNHWKARELEEMICHKFSVKHSHLLSSGTAALQTAMVCCGVSSGDEVIVPSFTFVASAEAVLAVGALPVFVEVDESLCICPKDLLRKITPKTKLVNVVHMCGSMAKMDEIVVICRKKDIVLLEDACQATGGTYQGKHLGTIGNVGTLSFDSVKTISCGEGGVIMTNDERIYQTAHQYSDHGHDHIGNDRGMEKHPIWGTNFRISEMNAAMGVAQFRKLDDILEKQRHHKSILKKALAKYDEVSFRTIPDEQGDNAGFLSFFLENRERAVEVNKQLSENGAGCFYWFDNNWHYVKKWQHILQYQFPAKSPLTNEQLERLANTQTPQSDSILSRCLSMLIMLNWDQAELDRRISIFDRIFK